MQKQTVAAAAVTVVNIAVAVTVNLLTSGWSWLIFIGLAVLSLTWVGLEIWRAAPKRAPRTSVSTPVVPGTFVPRPELTSKIVRALLAEKARRVGLTTAVAGAGGFGKTTLAREVFELPEIKDAFPLRHWVTVGQEVGGAALADNINNVIERITKQRPGITSPELAGHELGDVLRENGPSLLVVDDVWTAEQLRPFLNAGQGCRLLVTTRIPNLLSGYTDTQTVPVDQMSPEQARQLVTGGVTGLLPESTGEQLLEITGRWPIALSLANAALRRTARDGGDVVKAAERLLHRLREVGPTALDESVTARLERTVAATLESSLGVLGARRDQMLELAIFPDDTEVPLEIVALLWRATAGLSADECEHLCQELAELSLITFHGDRVRLHDVIRAYLQHECGAPRLKQLHAVLLNVVASTLPDPAARPVRWWNLPHSAGYLWRWLAYHLKEAGRGKEVAEVVTAPHWVISKLRRFGPVAVAEDLAFVSTGIALELNRFLDQIGHLLVPGTPDHAVVNALARRLPQSPGLEELRQTALEEVERLPRLVPEHALPDLPDPALNRVLEGHDSRARGCVFAPDGSWVASATGGLQVWHPLSGQLIRLVDASHPGIIALSPDGRFLAGEGESGHVQVWDTSTWGTRLVFNAHRGWINSGSYSPDGRVLVTAGVDEQLRVWDSQTGKQLRSLKAPEEVEFCFYLHDERLLTVDRECLRVWDIHADGRIDLPLSAFPEDLAISPDQKWAAVPVEEGLVLYDLTRLNEPPKTLHHHPRLTAVAFSPNGELLATGNDNGLVVLWNTAEWRPCGQIAAHGSEIDKLAFSPTGAMLASTSEDGTVRLWDPARARADVTHVRQASAADKCVVASDGTWLAVSDRNSITIHDPATRGVREEVRYSARIFGIAPLGSGALAVEQTREVLICDATNWQMSRTLRHPTGSRVDDMTAGGSHVCVVDSENRVVVWDVESWQPPAFLTVDEDGLHAHSEAPTTPNPVIAWIRRFLKRAKEQNLAIEIRIAPGGEWLAVSAGKVIHIVEPKTWNTVTTLRFREEPRGVEPAPHGGWLAVGIGDTVQYWSSDTWMLDASLIRRPMLTANGGAWSPDGSLLATVSDDRTLRIHDGGDWTVRTEIRLDGELNSCAWLSNDRLVAVGGHGVYWFTYMSGEVSI